MTHGVRKGRPDGDPGDDEVRTWLRVPEGLGIPSWARRRLGSGVRATRDARKGTPIHRVGFGIVDLETTGLSARRDRILEVGLVVLRGGRVRGRYSTLVAAGTPVPPVITEITGVDAAALVGAPAEVEALQGLAGVVREQGVEVLVAHNARFDRGFLEEAWARHGLSPRLPDFLCSLQLARQWVRAPSYGLDRLVEQLGIAAASRHRALGDAEMTAALWKELLERGRLHGVHTLEALREVAEIGHARGPSRQVRVVDV